MAVSEQAILAYITAHPGARRREVMQMAVEARLPEQDREQVLRYVERELRGLHAGNVIRYRLQPGDLESFRRP